jgi:RsmE family RNA methyltransferase
MNLIVLTDEDRVDDERFVLSDHRAEHLVRILRVEPGDTVEAGLLNGPAGRAEVTGLTDREVTLKMTELRAILPPSPEIDLICALPRPQTLKKVLLTCGMMGVRRLYLTRANRVERSFYQSPLLSPAAWRPFLLEGMSQGKWTRLPDVEIHDRFRRFFEDALPGREATEDKPGVKLLADLEAPGRLDRLLDRTASRVIIAIGPEGGWVPFEIELMERLGFTRFCLSRSVLRVEAAVVAALSQIELVTQRDTE